MNLVLVKWLFATILIANLSSIIEECGPNSQRRRKREVSSTLIVALPDADAELSEFFTSCLYNVASSIFPSVRSAVDFSIRDTHWYFENNGEICLEADGRNNSECWISALTFLLDSQSPLFIATAQCICDWVGDCPDFSEPSGSGYGSGYPGPAKRSVPFMDPNDIPNYHEDCPLTELDVAYSACIEASVANYTTQYPSLNYLDGQSISILLKNHYTYCRTYVQEAVYSPEWRTTFLTLYQRTTCPQDGHEADWRNDLPAVYEDGTMNESPVGQASRTCEAQLLEVGVTEFVGIPCEDQFKDCKAGMLCTYKEWRRVYCRKTCGDCEEEKQKPHPMS